MVPISSSRSVAASQLNFLQGTAEGATRQQGAAKGTTAVSTEATVAAFRLSILSTDAADANCEEPQQQQQQ
jgi:hypothetical protein